MPDARILLLTIVLSRMNADDYKLVGELVLKPRQVGDDVLTVDAARGPEIEQHYLTAQVR